MKKISKHISIPEELFNKVLAYKKEHHITYSEEICNMI